MINLIKFIIIKCNKILKIKKDKSKIKEKVEFYKIENQNDYFNFLVDINGENDKEENINDFNLSNLDQDIKQKIDEVFKKNVYININLDEEDDVPSDSGEFVDEIFNQNSEHSKEKEKSKIIVKRKDKIKT